MKRMVITLTVVIICAVLAHANTEVQTRVTAQGATRDKAINNGLHQAVSKVQGVAVSARGGLLDEVEFSGVIAAGLPVRIFVSRADHDADVLDAGAMDLFDDDL